MDAIRISLIQNTLCTTIFNIFTVFRYLAISILFIPTILIITQFWVSVYLLPFGLRYSGFMFWSLSPDYMVWPSLDGMDHICKVTSLRRNKPTLATNPLTMTEAHLSSKFNFSSTFIIRLILTLTRYITTVVWDRALPFVLALHCGNCRLI